MLDNPPYKDIGKRLKVLRGRLNQQKWAQQLNVSLRAYQRYEHGEVFPNPKLLSKLSKQFGINVDWIVTGQGETYISDLQPHLREALLKIDLIFTHGSDDLLDFFSEVVNLVFDTIHRHQKSNEPDALIEFLTQNIDHSSAALRKLLKRRLLLQYPKNGPRS